MKYGRKERDKQILNHKISKHKEIAKNMKKYKISEEKIAVIEGKQKSYEDWLKNIEEGGDY